MPVCLLLNIYHLFNVVSSPGELDSASDTPHPPFLSLSIPPSSFSTHLSVIIRTLLMFSSEGFGVLYFLQRCLCHTVF